MALKSPTTIRIGAKGQFTVPKQFRRELGLEAGAPLALIRLGDGLILLPEQQRFEQLCAQVSANLTAVSVTPEELLATLPEARERIYARRYRKTLARSTARRSSGSRRK